MAEKSSSLIISVSLDDETYRLLKKLETKGYVNRSRFIREAIKEKAEKMGLI